MVFVTGSSGLVGSHLLYALTEKGVQIRAMYRSKERIVHVEKLFDFYNKKNNTTLSAKDIEWVHGDLANLDALNSAMQGVETVFHCAALVSFLKSDFSECIKVNRYGTANVVNYCLKHNVKKLCYVSSTAALGNSKEPITEHTKWKPGHDISGYSVSKFAAEKEVFRGVAEGLNASIVNPCVILGPGNWGQGSLTIFNAAKKGLPFYTTGTNSIVDARDVANILLLLSESKECGEKYLLIGENTSFRNLFSSISKVLNVRSPRFKLNRGLGKSLAFIFEYGFRLFGSKSPFTIESMQAAYKELSYKNDKVKERFGYQFYSLEDTISNAVDGRFYD